MARSVYQRANNSNERTTKQLSVISLQSLGETATIFSKTLTDIDYKIWGVVLRGCSDKAIAFAFEKWNENGKFFPKPAEVLELIAAYQLSETPKVQLCGKCMDGWIVTNPDASPADYVVRRCNCVDQAVTDQKIAEHICDAACKRRHGRGYHTNDVIWLWKERQKSSKPWTEADYESALKRLDSTRAGGAPDFKQ
jgi:hypothetical protein